MSKKETDQDHAESAASDTDGENYDPLSDILRGRTVAKHSMMPSEQSEQSD